MATPTTLQQIVSSIRAEEFVPAAKCNAGISVDLKPPYISVYDFKSEYQYDTGGKALRNSVFIVIVVDLSCDSAETLAQQVDEFVNLNSTITFQTMTTYQIAYESNQMEPPLNQWGVKLVYELQEDPTVPFPSSSSSSS